MFLHTHASIIDNSGIFWIVEGAPFSYLAKEDLFKIPFFGFALRMIKAVPI